MCERKLYLILEKSEHELGGNKTNYEFNLNEMEINRINFSIEIVSYMRRAIS